MKGYAFVSYYDNYKGQQSVNQVLTDLKDHTINSMHYQCKLSNITKQLSNTILSPTSSNDYLTNISHDMSNLLSLSNHNYNLIHVPHNHYMNYPSTNLIMLRPITITPQPQLNHMAAYSTNSYIFPEPAIVYMPPDPPPQLTVVLITRVAENRSNGMQGISILPSPTVSSVLNTTPNDFV